MMASVFHAEVAPLELGGDGALCLWGPLSGAGARPVHGMSTPVTDGAPPAPSPVDLAMDRYARGDDAAFSEVYDLLAPRLLRYLTRQTRNVALAEDLVQQTLLRIHRARGRFHLGAAVVPWAIAISRRLLIDDLRYRKGDRLARSIDDEPGADLPDPHPSAEGLLAASELRARLDRELAKLPAQQREAFELLKDEELSLAEAAAVLGTTVTAVKLRAHRAYVTLREALGDMAPEPETGARPERSPS